MFPKLMHARLHSKMESWSEVEQDLLPVVVDQQRDAADVGAHVGSYTLALANLVRTVYAFEPDQEMAGMLRRVSPRNVHVCSQAVSDRVGTSTLHVPTHNGRRANTCGSLVTPLESEYEARAVKTTTLDVALPDPDIGFIKIDVEGAEQSVLVGAKQLIDRCQPVILVEANTPEAVARVSAFFEPLDYAGFFVRDRKTFGLTDFEVEMQNPQSCEEHGPRREMRFLNNFIFAPRDAEAGLRTKVDGFLSRQNGLTVR